MDKITKNWKEKSNIIPIRNNVTLLGYRVFYHRKLLKKSNLRKFKNDFSMKLEMYKNEIISKEDLIQKLQRWFGYATWANTFKLRKNIIKN